MLESSMSVPVSICENGFHQRPFFDLGDDRKTLDQPPQVKF